MGYVYKFRKGKDGTVYMAKFTPREAEQLRGNASWVDDPHILGWSSLMPVKQLGHTDSLAMAGIKAETTLKKQKQKKEIKTKQKVLLWRGKDVLTLEYQDVFRLKKVDLIELYRLLGGKHDVSKMKRTDLVKWVDAAIKQRR